MINVRCTKRYVLRSGVYLPPTRPTLNRNSKHCHNIELRPIYTVCSPLSPKPSSLRALRLKKKKDREKRNINPIPWGPYCTTSARVRLVPPDPIIAAAVVEPGSSYSTLYYVYAVLAEQHKRSSMAGGSLCSRTARETPSGACNCSLIIITRPRMSRYDISKKALRMSGLEPSVRMALLHQSQQK